MAEKFVDVRLSEADAELTDFALDLVSDAYADQAMADGSRRSTAQKLARRW